MKYIEELESEAIYILRETFSELNHTFIFWRKDSIVLSHLIKKGILPCPYKHSICAY